MSKKFKGTFFGDIKKFSIAPKKSKNLPFVRSGFVCYVKNEKGSGDPVTRILARLPRCMGMLAKILARSCKIMQDHGKADHASYQAYQDFPCILPSFSMCLAKHTKIFPTILSFYCIHELQ